VASVLGQNPYVERRTGERRRIATPVQAKEGFDGLRVSWGGVWGGVLVTLGSLMLLTALGVAVGMTAMDPARADMNRLAAVATIWGAVSFLASLFFGGFAATRIGMIYDRATGVFEGGLVWVMSLLVLGVFAGSGLGLLPDVSFDLTESRTAAWVGVGAMVLSLVTTLAGAMSGRRGAALRAGRERP
jgi:hypothetical protein